MTGTSYLLIVLIVTTFPRNKLFMRYSQLLSDIKVDLYLPPSSELNICLKALNDN